MTKLEEVFKQRKIQEQTKKEIVSISMIEFPQFDEEVEINTYLNKVGLEILNIGVKSELAVGKKLEEVFQRLGNSKTGVYQKFLHTLSINPRTALRQRMRYNYYNKFLSLGYNKAKEIISIAPIIYLEKLNSLCKDKDSEEIILEYLSNENMTVLEFKEMIDNELKAKNKIEEGSIDILDQTFKVKWKALNKLSKKVENLSNDKQKEIIEYLDKIQLILNENDIKNNKEIKEAEIVE